MKERLKQRPYIIPLAGLVLGLCIVAAIWVSRGSGQTFRPSDAHVVYLYDSGGAHVLDTKAATVGELISRLNLQRIKDDVVAPSLNTPIVEDNFRINIYRARPVTVVDGQERKVTLTAQRSPRTVAKAAGLEVKAEDIASFARGDLHQNILGEQVVVARATPVTLNWYGTQVNTFTQAKTVEGLLVEKQIKLENGESVIPGLDTPIKPKMQVFVLAKGASVETREVKIEAPVRYVDDASLSFGSTAERQEGSDGKKLVTYLVSKKDGKVSRKLIQQAVIEPPVPKVVAKGTTIKINRDKTALMAAAGISSGDYAYVNYIISRESNWRPTAANPSGAYGLCQALPGSKMATAGSDWRTNPITQLEWCSGYASRTYGGWGGAYNFWLGHNYW
jgi:uncharacterized protein YabE (DUF348 family)